MRPNPLILPSTIKLGIVCTRPRLNLYRFLSTSRQAHEEHRLTHIEQQFSSFPRNEQNKSSFMAIIGKFKEQQARGHVEFINAALKCLKQYNVHKDIEIYKALLDIFPKGKMVPTSTFQRIMLHYPQQQNCCVKVLDEMEWHGVAPDKEVHDIVVNAFGEWNFATKKIKRMMYWMPKLKNTNKYLDKRKIDSNNCTKAELAGHALRMMARDPSTKLDYLKMGTDDDHDWVASAQSPLQKTLISNLPSGHQVSVDGPFCVYVGEHRVEYVVLSASPYGSEQTDDSDFVKHNMPEDESFSDWFNQWKHERRNGNLTIHEQKHETILGMASMSVNNNQMARHWIDYLQTSSPSLTNVVVHLRLDKGAPLFYNEQQQEAAANA